jgi:hypothetical protein
METIRRLGVAAGHVAEELQPRRAVGDRGRGDGGSAGDHVILPVVTLGDLVMILDLARQGLTVSAIARRTGHDRKTIRKYIERGMEPPAYKPREPEAGPKSRAPAWRRVRL